MLSQIKHFSPKFITMKSTMSLKPNSLYHHYNFSSWKTKCITIIKNAPSIVAFGGGLITGTGLTLIKQFNNNKDTEDIALQMTNERDDIMCEISDGDSSSDLLNKILISTKLEEFLFQKNVASCLPKRPVQMKLFEPLYIVKSRPPTEGNDRYMHDFRYKYTLDAVENMPPLKGSQTFFDAALSLSYDDWQLTAAKVLGKNGFGKIKVYHMILTEFSVIKNDIIKNHQTMRVCSDQPNWIWFSQETAILTMLWDESVDAYRFYLNKGYVIIETGPDIANNPTVLKSIKFISPNMAPLTPTLKSGPYIKEVIKHFDEDFERLRKNMTYMY